MNMILPQNFWTIAVIVVPAAAIYASVIDYREHRVPNGLNAGLALCGIMVQAAYFGWSGVGTALAGLATGFGLLILPWIMHSMGAGDVKLIAAIGAWMGPWLTLVGFVTGVLVGGVMGAIIILRSGKRSFAKANFVVLLAKHARSDAAFSEFGSTKSFGDTTTLLPYGIPLTIGALLILGGRYLEWSVLL